MDSILPNSKFINGFFVFNLPISNLKSTSKPFQWIVALIHSYMCQKWDYTRKTHVFILYLFYRRDRRRTQHRICRYERRHPEPGDRRSACGTWRGYFRGEIYRLASLSQLHVSIHFYKVEQVNHNSKHRCTGRRQADHGKACIRLNAHEVGHRQTYHKGLCKSL